MQWRNDIPKQTNEDGASLCKTQPLQWRPRLVTITTLALATLACSLFNTTSRLDYDHTLIRKTLPTLTPTPILSPQVEQDSENVAVIPPTALPPTLVPTFTPANTTASQSTVASSQLTSLVELNVRAGPGLDYPVVGQLTQGQTTEVIGRNPEGTWWQIVYPPGNASSGWVSADTQYATVTNGEAVQIVQIPSLPAVAAVPTNTPTVPLTPTLESVNNPTLQPTAVAASESPNWSFADIRLDLGQYDDILMLYGNAVNVSKTPQELAFITGTFYDAQNQVIADETNVYDYWFIDIVPPGGQIPFELTVYDIRSAANFNLRIEAEPSSETPRQDFEFSELSQWNELGAYCVTGNLRNLGGELQDYLLIAAILYDDQDKVINFSDYIGADIEEMNKQQKTGFEICVDPLNQNVARYDLQAWGL